jgi:glycine oxidase
MAALSRKAVVVAGAGAFGSACALAAARQGWRVVLIDSAPLAANASGIAAGMLAPAFEAALDPASAGHYSLLAEARDLWPAFVEGIGPTGLDRCGALLEGPEDLLKSVRDALEVQGAATQRVGDRLFTPEDWRIEPRLALAAFRQALTALGGEVLRTDVVAVEDDIVLADGRRLAFDAVILACGFGGHALVPELAVLTPIKGQLLRYVEAGPREGAILRSPTGYLAPGLTGAVVGATMDPGRSDLDVEPLATERLKAQAARLYPSLASARAEAFTGIRAATPDNLPMIGRAAGQGKVWIATGARRNGWLFAPLAAGMIIDQIAGNEDAAWETTAFAPGRFPNASTEVEDNRNANL